MANNFIITGHGRSGTKFLATVMNRSTKWSVQHEPKPVGVITTWAQCASRFDRDYYGEVNSYLRVITPTAPVEKTAVILRDPAEITVSFYNRRVAAKRNPSKDIETFSYGFHQVDRCVAAGVPVLWFKDLVNDHEYLQRILRAFDVNDVEITQSTCLTSINGTPKRNKKALTVDGCNEYVRNFYYDQIHWFKEKYFNDKKAVFNQV